MGKYSSEELSEAIALVTSTIVNCEKMQLKFAEGTSQHTLLKNRINALYISKALLLGEDSGERYSLEELRAAEAPITSIISKSTKGQSKFTEGTGHYTRFQKIISAMVISKALLLEEISKRN